MKLPRIAAALLAAGLLLAGCGPADAPEPTSSASAPAASETGSPAEDAAFPRAVLIPAGLTTEKTEVTIEAEPVRVAALTFETAEVVAALGAADRLVMVPEAVMNPALGNHLDEMADVAAKNPVESKTNAEAVIASDPDLVLLSTRHGLEEGVADALITAAIPVIVLPNSWVNVDDMVLNVDLVGQALGLDDEADALAAEIAGGMTEATPAADPARVLVLSNQAGQPFVTAGAAFPLEVLRMAGAEDAGEVLGMRASGPITAEQVIQADPDAILLIDMNGSDERLFSSLLDNPAVATLPAVAEDRILLLEGRQIQALGLEHVGEGLVAIRDWLATQS